MSSGKYLPTFHRIIPRSSSQSAAQNFIFTNKQTKENVRNAGHEDEGGMIYGNVGKYLPVDKTKLLKRLEFSSTML